MLETMYAAPGIGLAAIQVGVPRQVIVMDLARQDDPPEPRYFVNPEILWASDETALYEEGCLSVPEVYDEVARAAQVRLRYLDYNGREVVEEAEGLFAVCIQHEMDHLKGVLFIDPLSRLKRDRAVARVRKLARTG
jgi:peptide deformylase